MLSPIPKTKEQKDRNKSSGKDPIEEIYMSEDICSHLFQMYSILKDVSKRKRLIVAQVKALLSLSRKVHRESIKGEFDPEESERD